MNNEKFISKAGEMQEITNDMLDCKNCRLKYKNSTIECTAYVKKPLKVIDGGKCEKKVADI